MINFPRVNDHNLMYLMIIYKLRNGYDTGNVTCIQITIITQKCSMRCADSTNWCKFTNKVQKKQAFYTRNWGV